jgi:hypothetical protein
LAHSSKNFMTWCNQHLKVIFTEDDTN